ncbi:MAG: hypothetical protein GX858_02560 [Clostridiales bacterium]|nr:hypothetical protein [Clostridiales bacterium]
MKKTLLLCVLALSLVLSGCSLVVKDPVVDMQQTVLEINGQAVSKQTFLNNYNLQINQEMQMQQLYQMYGMDAPATDYTAVQNRAKDAVIRQELISQQAVKLQLDQLTEEEKAELQTEIDTEYEKTLKLLQDNYLPDTTLEGDELAKSLEQYAQDTGNTKENLTTYISQDFINRKVEADIVKDVAVTDEEVKADYDAKVEEDKAAFEANPDSYGQKINSGDVPYFAPEGYRWVKQVLIKFLAEDQAEIDRINGEKSTADGELQTALNAQTANAEALAAQELSDEDKAALEAQTADLTAAVVTAQENVNKLAVELLAARNKGYEHILPAALDVYNSAKTEGQSFDELAKEFNQDTGMPEVGYAIREGFASFDEAFVKPAMALTTIGDVAEPSQGIYGYYIVQYAGDVTPGEVGLDTVRDELHTNLLEQAKTETWEAAIAQWTQDADIKEYMDRLKD